MSMRSWLHDGLFVFAVATACAAPRISAAPAPVVSAAQVPAAVAPSGEAEPALADVPAGPIRFAWSCETASWNRIVAIGPDGNIISVGSGKIHVHARDTGVVVKSAEICFVKSRRALAFTGSGRAVLACTDGIREVSLPGLETRIVSETDALSVASAASENYVAYADRDGRVEVLRTDGYASHDRFSAGGEVEELAFSADGSVLAIGRRDGAVMLRALQERSSSILEQSSDRRATGLSFSRDGKLLFVNNEVFGVRVYDTLSGTVDRRHRVGPWVSSSSDLGDGWFAAAGSDGIVIFGPNAERGQKLDAGQLGPTTSCEGLDVSRDGTLLCTGDRRGRVACFTTKPLKK